MLTDKKYINLIREKLNHGFGKACNIGAAHTNSKYILFLNPDDNETSIEETKSLWKKKAHQMLVFAAYN